MALFCAQQRISYAVSYSVLCLCIELTPCDMSLCGCTVFAPCTHIVHTCHGADACAYMHSRLHAYIRTFIQTYALTHIDGHQHLCLHTCKQFELQDCSCYFGKSPISSICLVRGVSDLLLPKWLLHPQTQ